MGFHLKVSRFGAPNPAGAFWSAPKRSGRQFHLQFGRFGGPISGREATWQAGRPIWGSKYWYKLAVWGSAFWRLQSRFPPKDQSIWGYKSGRSVLERSKAL